MKLLLAFLSNVYTKSGWVATTILIVVLLIVLVVLSQYFGLDWQSLLKEIDSVSN